MLDINVHLAATPYLCAVHALGQVGQRSQAGPWVTSVLAKTGTTAADAPPCTGCYGTNSGHSARNHRDETNVHTHTDHYKDNVTVDLPM